MNAQEQWAHHFPELRLRQRELFPGVLAYAAEERQRRRACLQVSTSSEDDPVFHTSAVGWRPLSWGQAASESPAASLTCVLPCLYCVPGIIYQKIIYLRLMVYFAPWRDWDLFSFHLRWIMIFIRI
jgi:hypothetical protein